MVERCRAWRWGICKRGKLHVCIQSTCNWLYSLKIILFAECNKDEQIGILSTASATIDDNSCSNTALYATIAVLAVVVAILAVATAFVCVLKRRLDALKEEQANYVKPACCGRDNGRNNAAYQDIYQVVN